MIQDPFGDLSEWVRVLALVDEVADDGRLAECQPGLIRILRYKGNWQLREKVLTRVGEIEDPSSQLVFQVLNLLADDNIYYDVRILASHALIQLIKNLRGSIYSDIGLSVKKVAQRLSATPQPIIFDRAIRNLCSEMGFGNTSDA